ncbi:ankyrin repeat domain-containing protein, partial [Candidatus Babeliales bacterium]|nr:ankyrin repeat domain-containing protein [Candidatus Babeliales bacterium]
CLQWPVGTNIDEPNHRPYLKSRVSVAKPGEEPSSFYFEQNLGHTSKIIEMCLPGLLHLAAAHASLEVVKRLIELGMDPDESDSMGRKPIVYAQIYNRIDNEKELSINVKPAKR